MAATSSSPAIKPDVPRRAKPAKSVTPDLPPSESIGYLVRELHRTFMRSLEPRIARRGISSGMWWFLRILWIEDGVSQVELSEHLGVMGPTTVRAMDRLERHGLITRTPSADDKRKVLIHLTEEGRRLKKDLMPSAIEVNTIATANLSELETGLLRQLLARVQANLLSDTLAPGIDERPVRLAGSPPESARKPARRTKRKS